MKTTLKGLARNAVKSMPPLYRQYNRFRGWRIHDAETQIPYQSMGGDGGAYNYGAWVVPCNLINSESVVYSFGIGEDITFDLELIETFGCKVFAYDPTPDAVTYVKHVASDPRFIFSQIGVAAEDGIARFLAPVVDDPSFTMPHAKFEDAPIVSQDFLELPVNRISSLMEQNGHHHIDLLKMDIEGFEYAVIDDMLSGGIIPKCIILEFHHYQRKDPHSTRRAVTQLKGAGYELFWVSELGAEYGFYQTGRG